MSFLSFSIICPFNYCSGLSGGTSPKGSCICSLWSSVFWCWLGVWMELLQHGAFMEEVCHWRWASRAYSLLTSSFLLLLAMWGLAVVSQLHVPGACCILPPPPAIIDIQPSGYLVKINSFSYRLVLVIHFWHTNRKATNLLFKNN